MKERRKGVRRTERIIRPISRKEEGPIPLDPDHRLAYLNGNGSLPPGSPSERSLLERLESTYEEQP